MCSVNTHRPGEHTYVSYRGCSQGLICKPTSCGLCCDLVKWVCGSFALKFGSQTVWASFSSKLVVGSLWLVQVTWFIRSDSPPIDCYSPCFTEPEWSQDATHTSRFQIWKPVRVLPVVTIGYPWAAHWSPMIGLLLTLFLKLLLTLCRSNFLLCHNDRYRAVNICTRWI